MLKHILIGIVIGVLLASAVVVVAGNLEPRNPPDATSSYIVEDVYNRLNAGTAGTPRTFTEPNSGPASSMHTLNQLMAIAPALDAEAGAAAADVAQGKTFWGLTSGAWGLRTGTATGSSATYEAGVPRTGQTTCYDASEAVIECTGTGQDGAYQRGVAWPNPRFTDNGEGTVTDNLTGLIWLKDANCFGTRDWTTALSDANTLNSGECDLTDGSVQGDWRLPNRFELESLLHLGYWNFALSNTDGTDQWTEGEPFTNVQGSYYWSSTTFAGSTSYAWSVGVYSGYMKCFDKTGTYMYDVWPVRGGQ